MILYWEISLETSVSGTANLKGKIGTLQSTPINI